LPEISTGPALFDIAVRKAYHHYPDAL